MARRGSWRAARFLAVDIETTGLDARTDEIISFAAVPVEHGRVVSGGAVSGLVRPRVAPPAESIEIHGLRAADLENAPQPPGALAPLAAELRGRIPIAHAAWVERAFLQRPLEALGGTFSRRCVDTAALWRLLCLDRGEDDPGWCNLGAVAGALGLPSHRPHEAEGDALTTAQVFLGLATHLEAYGRATPAALTAAQRRLRGSELWRPPG